MPLEIGLFHSLASAWLHDYDFDDDFDDDFVDDFDGDFDDDFDDFYNDCDAVDNDDANEMFHSLASPCNHHCTIHWNWLVLKRTRTL